jgi:hypothetical protein
MPRDDKSSYTDKQKRQAEPSKRVMKIVVSQRNKRSSGLGLP